MKFCGGRKPPYTIPLPFKLVSFLRNKAAKTILEIGCGYGRACIFLRENGFEVVGVDVDSVQVKFGLVQKKFQGIEAGIDLFVNDAQHLCFQDCSFDAATMLGVFTFVPKVERSKIMTEVERVLKPSGTVFIEEFGRTWENPVYRKRYGDDVGVTGELGTIAVKDKSGRILHFGHHFTRKELCSLLKDFDVVSFEKDTFTSYYHRNWVKGYAIVAQKRRK